MNKSVANAVRPVTKSLSCLDIFDNDAMDRINIIVEAISFYVKNFEEAETSKLCEERLVSFFCTQFRIWMAIVFWGALNARATSEAVLTGMRMNLPESSSGLRQ
jgi:hypothetical protein